MNIHEVSIFLRDFHMKDEVINKLCSFNELLQTLNKNIQRCCYERFVIKLAIAYEGYRFYLPAFLDFRGRIYRCGVIHFHERDLARSMIVIADSNSKDNINKSMDYYTKIRKTLTIAAAYHYKSFVSDEDALKWFYNNINQIDYKLFEYIREAKNPFQFLAFLTSIDMKLDVGPSLLPKTPQQVHIRS
jgi:hypothetical protein